MKKKFLTMALASLATALVVVPGAYAETTNGSSSSSVDVTGSTTFTITVNGDVQQSDFTASAGGQNTEATVHIDAQTDNIVVVDHSDVAGTEGHEVFMTLDTAYWTYSGNATGGTDLLVTSSATPGDDEIYFAVDFSTGTFVVNSNIATACSESNAGMSGDADVITDGSLEEVARTTDAGATLNPNEQICPATYTYVPAEVKTVGPDNGYKAGTYSITGRVVGINSES